MSERRDTRVDLLVGRVLGPAETEISCEDCFDQLDRYVELELAGGEADASVPGMRAHLVGCSACAEDRDSLRDFLTKGKDPR